MRIELKTENELKKTTTYDIIMAFIKADEPLMLAEIIKNLKPNNAAFYFREIYINSSPETKKYLAYRFGNGKFFTKELISTFKEQSTYGFGLSKTKQKFSEVVNINSFEDLQKLVLKNRSLEQIFDFARCFNVDNERFLNVIKQCGSDRVVNSFRCNILNIDTPTKDDLQLL
jgi:hypothetical protein